MDNPTTPMRVLSFDPGEITGISYVIDGIMIWAMIAEAHAFQRDSFLQAITSMTDITHVLVELPPTSGKFYNSKQSDIFHRLMRWFTIAGFYTQQISPGQWKNLVKRSDISSTHMRDATDMAIWYTHKEMRLK